MVLKVMKNVFCCFFASLLLLVISCAQEENLLEEIPLDWSLPSQELFQDAFKESAPAVVWLDWSIYPFAKAIALDKPILLNISVSWDESCYRMDTEIFSDPEVAYLINNLFVPIRVDGDKRPDIRDTYQAQIWPSIFFLMPNGNPIIWEEEGGERIPISLGYVRPDTVKTIGFRVFNYYKGERKKVLNLSSELMKSEEKSLKLKPGVFDQEIIYNTVSSLKGNFDLQNGGFGQEPKFPIPSAIEFALLLHSMESNPLLLEISAKTLKAIMKSALNDKVDGGLFRLAMKADWSEPVHEKLLNRNALVLSNLIDMYQVSGEEIYKKYALSIIQYINNNLLSEDGGFLAGQLSDFGYWDGYYDQTEKEKKWSTKPGFYKTIFCDWNSVTASAYIKASFALNDESLLEMAKRNIDFLLEHLYYPGRGVFHSFENGRGEHIGFLEDQALFCLALLDLYQATGSEAYLTKAQDVGAFMIDNLEDIVGGGFFDFLRNDKAPGKLKLPLKSLEGNALVSRAMIRLYYMTGAKKYLMKASRTLRLFSESYLPYEVFASPYAMASVEFFHQPLKVLVVGESDQPEAKELIKEGNRIPELWKIVTFIDIEKEDITQIGLDPGIKPALYLIKESFMSAPLAKSKKVIPGYKRFKKNLQSKENR